jgi:hypothetical protein
MNGLLFVILLAISSALVVFFFLLSLRRLGTKPLNLAILFVGINQLLLTSFISSYAVQAISVGIGLFVIVFSLVKILRKM